MNINKPEIKTSVFLSIIYHNLRRILFFVTETTQTFNLGGQFVCAKIDKTQKQPPEVFCKKKYSEKIRKIHRKTLRPATLLKKRLWYRCFPVTFAKFLGIPILQNTSGQLLLKTKSRSLQNSSWKIEITFLMIFVVFSCGRLLPTLFYIICGSTAEHSFSLYSMTFCSSRKLLSKVPSDQG